MHSRHGRQAAAQRQQQWRLRVGLVVLVISTIWVLLAMDPATTFAQDGCIGEVEPNDAEQQAPLLSGPFCMHGSLPAGDQDFALWEVRVEDVPTRWHIELEGVPGTLTILNVFVVTSAPDDPSIRVDGQAIIEVAMNPGDEEAAVSDSPLLVAGRYMVGITRSAVPGGGEPATEEYRYRFGPGDALPMEADAEPNDDVATAGALVGAFEISGDLGGSSDDVYTWTVPQATARWGIDVQVPLTERVSLDLEAADGRSIYSLSVERSDAGRSQLYDLQLDPGTYVIRLGPVGPVTEYSSPYLLRATIVDISGDPEPNDQTADAVPIGDDEPVRGRLAARNDEDRYALTVPPGPAMLREIRLLWRSEQERTLCLLDDLDQSVACRRGSGGLTLPNLLLSPGLHTLQVRGLADPADGYLLRVDVLGEAASDVESEPNDQIALATRLDPSLVMRARGGALDDDFFELEVGGPPQLWRIDLMGPHIENLELTGPDGQSRARGDVDVASSVASLEDIYLVPGPHWLLASTDGPEYTLRATALGPPDPDGELEPNDEAARAQRYRIGTRRIGRLPNATDRDFFRFTLGAPQHVQFELTQPADARTAMRVWGRDIITAELQGLPAGEAIAYDLWLPAGDHVIELYPEQSSEGTYVLTSARLDPFTLRVDQEPNDEARSAQAVPRSLAWNGRADDPGDEDWYALPALTADELLISLTGGPASVRLGVFQTGSDRVDQLAVERRSDGLFASVAHPPDVPLVLMVAASGDYEGELSGAGLSSVIEPETADIQMAWQVAHDQVAAYWPEEQVVEASLELTNPSDQDLRLTLATTTSHHLWRVALGKGTVDLPAGATVRVPATIIAGADAWGDEPVLVSARAITSVASQASASVSISTSPDILPVDPRQGWSVPDELLGGLNVAATAFGAAAAGTLDADDERRLYDGVTPQGSTAVASPIYGNGFVVFISHHVEQLPIEMSVDLAGDGPIAVVGTIINLQAGEGHLREMPEDFELLLSQDGVVWEPALRGTLSAMPTDQAFVLDEAVDASHAMLRILSKNGNQRDYIALGEWKVVAQPGTPVTSGPINIADPVQGGHVVLLDPIGRDPDIGTQLLDVVLEPGPIDLDMAESVSLVIGFKEGRAAQIERLEWQDPRLSRSDERLERVDVSISLRGPTGPWQALGNWELVRAGAGDVAPFVLDVPTWVRYLRLEGVAPPEARAVELPATLRVIERETDEDYRSIVGEWGYRSSQGPYEWLAAAPRPNVAPAVDAGDTMAAATGLAAGSEVADIVETSADEDWFAIQIPDDDNTLEIVLEGQPSVRVGLSLFDAVGTERPMAFRIADDGSVIYQAGVDGGSAYTLQVEQPPFSAVFAFDTSPSIDPFVDMVRQGMASFLSDVQPGREVVTVLPFEERPLLAAWQDDPYVLQAAFDNHLTDGTGSSAAERGLIEASELLLEREGGRAILIVTDAETTSSDQTPQLWAILARARPIIHSVHIGAVVEPVQSAHLMQDWAASGGDGHYSYPTTHGEMDRAFDRMATSLRRPAAYSLRYETLNLGPSTLSVRAPATDVTDGPAPTAATGVGVEVILDTSGSMLDKLKGVRRIDIAKEALRGLIGKALPDELPVALRTFGGKGTKAKARCETRLSLPLRPLDRREMLALVTKIVARKTTKTPIAAALAAVVDDLAEVSGPRSVVLVTDGAETCGGDPLEAIEQLRAAGIDFTLNIVGFALEDEELKGEMAAWAEAGDGTYFDAGGADELAASLATALAAPFRVYGPDGEVYEGGTVNGAAIQIDPGTYRVEVLVDPVIEFDEVVVQAGQAVELELTAG